MPDTSSGIPSCGALFTAAVDSSNHSLHLRSRKKSSAPSPLACPPIRSRFLIGLICDVSTAGILSWTNRLAAQSTLRHLHSHVETSSHKFSVAPSAVAEAASVRMPATLSSKLDSRLGSMNQAQCQINVLSTASSEHRCSSVRSIPTVVNSLLRSTGRFLQTAGDYACSQWTVMAAALAVNLL